MEHIDIHHHSLSDGHVVVAEPFFHVLIAIGGCGGSPPCPTFVRCSHTTFLPYQVQPVGVEGDTARKETTHTQRCANRSAIVVAGEFGHQRAVIVEVLAHSDEVVSLTSQILADEFCAVFSRPIFVEIIGKYLLRQPVHIQRHSRETILLQVSFCIDNQGGVVSCGLEINASFRECHDVFRRMCRDFICKPHAIGGVDHSVDVASEPILGGIWCIVVIPLTRSEHSGVVVGQRFGHPVQINAFTRQSDIVEFEECLRLILVSRLPPSTRAPS